MQLLGRRDFLASMGLGPGAYLLGSIFKSNLLPEAMGAATTKKHFFMVTRGQGWLEELYTCNARSETDFDLAAGYAPLAPFKKDLVIASKFYNHIDRILHGNTCAFLSVMPSPTPVSDSDGGLPGGVSIERAIAKVASAGDPFPALSYTTSLGDRSSISADGPRQLAVSLDGPAHAYDRLFGVGAPSAVRRSQRKAVLDFISGDIKKMNRQLAGPEKAKLDQYVTSLSGLEQRIDALAKPVVCEQPATPLASFRHAAGMPYRADETDATVDLAFHAHLCGLTHVSQIQLPTMQGHPQLDFLRTADDANQHLYEDNDGRDTFMDVHNMMHRLDYPRITRVDQWLNGRVALLLDRLSKAKDPGGSGGTMLDNSLAVSLDFCGGKHHYGHDSFSVLMAGKAGGAIKTGRYLTYPEGQHCISDVFTAWANAMDARMDKFGDPSACKGPLPGLLG